MELKSKCIDGGNPRRWYIKTYGWIPADVWILHKCDNGRCRNIDHIFLGNRSDNAKDSANKGRWSVNYGTKKLNEDLVKQIRNSPEKSNWDWAKELKVDCRTIRFVREFKTWRHIK